MYYPEGANARADALNRIHHPVSATPAATSRMNSMTQRVIGTVQSMQAMSELQLEELYHGRIVNNLAKDADTTN
jgi:hypothetical protein